MPGEKFLRLSVKIQLVLYPQHTVAFVVVNEVFDGLVRLAHRLDHLLALALDNADVVPAVGDQERRLDVVDEKSGERDRISSSSFFGSPTRRLNSASEILQ